MVDPTDGDGPTSRFRINSVEITNYKAIDHLKLDFPEPLLPDDPDVFVIGSRNGVGKTSVLEACALTLYCRKVSLEPTGRGLIGGTETSYFSDRTIKSSSDNFNVEIDATNDVGLTIFDRETTKIQLLVSRHSTSITSSCGRISEIDRDVEKTKNWDQVWSILGNNSSSVFSDRVLFFSAYRQIQTGGLTASQLVGFSSGPSSPRAIERIPSVTGTDPFKNAVSRLLLGRSGLIESENESDALEKLTRLNELVEKFAKGRIEKFKDTAGSRFDLRVMPRDGSPSFSFDSLSSGLKELISMLFLIWSHTLKNPSVVFIDEPELHLNAEWHKPFIYELTRLAPWNQYILATHSPDVFAAVQPRHRVILRPGTGEVESFKRAAGGA